MQDLNFSFTTPTMNGLFSCQCVSACVRVVRACVRGCVCVCGVDYNSHRYVCTKASALICLYFLFSVCMWRYLAVR